MLGLRFALIGITALALPGAVRSVDESFVARALNMPGARWRVVTTPNATLRALRGSAAEAHVERFAPLVEEARRANLERLGVEKYPPKLELFFVGSRDQMKPFVGWTPGGMAVPGESAAIFVANDSVRPALRHELMHVLSHQTWGPPENAWISEGLAMDAVGRCHGYAIDTMAAALAAEDRLVPLAGLPARFDSRGHQGVIYYTQAASVVRYVGDTFGRDKLRRFWSSGLAGVAATLGIDLRSLERGWRRRLSAVPHPTPWATIAAEVRRNGCE